MDPNFKLSEVEGLNLTPSYKTKHRAKTRFIGKLY